MVASCIGMAIMSALLAIGLNNSYQVLSAIAIISFIVCSPIRARLTAGIILNRPRPRSIPPSLRASSLACDTRPILTRIVL